MNEDSEDSNYLSLSENEVSLSDEEFIMPEDPVEREHFKCQLIATAKILKKKKQQPQVDQDLLTGRWTEVLEAEEYGLEHPTKSYLKRLLLPQLEEEALETTLLIRLQRIYNFLLFRAIILPVLDVYGLYFTHLYHFWD